jgi:nitrous oxidase accessory protein
MKYKLSEWVENMLNKQKKLTGTLLIILFALSLLFSAGIADAKPTTVKIYPGSSIQNAINNANPGDTIIVNEGIYLENLVVWKPLTIKGVGATLISPLSGSRDGIEIQAAALVTGFKIQPETTTDFFRSGIFFYSTSSSGAAAINNEIMPGFTYPAVWVADPTGIGPTGIKIQNNKIHASITAISLEEGSEITITGNIIEASGKIEDPGANGFGIWSADPNSKVSNLNIANNIIHSGTGDGIFVSPGMGAEAVSITNNKIVTDSTGTYPFGIQIAKTKGIVISGNEITVGSETSGIFLEYCTKIQIIGNKIEAGTNTNGIWVSSSTNCKILGNLVSSLSGISVTNTQEIQISSNDIFSTWGVGISVETGSNIIITLNVVRNSVPDGRGINLNTCNNILLLNNKITVIEWGLTFYGLTNAVIAGNEITVGPKIIIDPNYGPVYYATYGVIFSDSSFCTISKNIIKSTKDSGIYGYGQGCHDIVIQDNVITADPTGGTNGIRLYDVSKSTVFGNSVNGPYYYGVRLDGESNTNTISKNTIALFGGSNFAGISLNLDTWGNLVKNNKISGTSVSIEDLSGLNTIIP